MKKILSILLAAGFTFSSLVATAEEIVLSEDFVMPVEEVAQNSNEPTTKEMEEMIKKVRPLFDIPEDYNEFNWYYSAPSVYNESSWQFFWENAEKGEYTITCDNKGRITGYRFYEYNRRTTPKFPTVSPDVYEQKAREFIKKTSPFTNDSELVLEGTSTGSLFSNHYNYTFTRYENSIPTPSEQISVSINYVTGDITNMTCYYTTDIDFKAPENVIDIKKAKEILSEKQNMILSYRLKTEYDDDGNLTSRKAYLVYTPEIGYLSVDAETGEVYTERSAWVVVKRAPTVNGAYGDIMFDSAAKEESAESEGGYQLSEEELAQLEVLASLITKDEAVNIVTSNKDLYIDPLATVVRANLRKNNSGVRPIAKDGNQEKQENYIWDIEFSAPETLGANYPYYYHGMNAAVDAKTGELISFYAQIPDYYYYEETQKDVPELKYSADKALEIARSFIEKIQPEKSKLLGKESVSENTPILYLETENGKRTPVYGARRFNFVRQNEGIDFTYNSFRIGVELVSGKITNYGYTWYDDVEFESPKDAISQKDALMSLYDFEGFGINYEINTNYTYNEYLLKEKNGEFIDYDELFDKVLYSRAVYSLYNSGTNTIRALDGVMIDYSGNEYSSSAGVYSYTDIDSHWAKQTIERLAWVGIGKEGEKFDPNGAVTFEEFTQLCNEIGLYFYDEEQKEGPISRMDAVVYIIESLGYGKIARLENVFITDFVDNSDFHDEHIGFAAIARGFGLIEGDGENFRPYDTLTRAEAYTIVENVVDLGIMNN